MIIRLREVLKLPFTPVVKMVLVVNSVGALLLLALFFLADATPYKVTALAGVGIALAGVLASLFKPEWVDRGHPRRGS